MQQLKTILYALLIGLSCLNLSQGQTALKPILLNKAALSGIGLEKVVLEQEPDREFFQRRVLRGDDISVYIVSSQSWTTRMDNFAIDEVVYMLNGKALIAPEKGDGLEFQSNEFFFIPKGYTGSWEIQAGDNYHYELSVIATQRVSSINPPNVMPVLLEKNKLSGLDIKLDSSGSSETILSKGIELTVALRAERPQETIFSNPVQEQLVHVLSGQVIVTDTQDTTYTFHTGDFFMLPKGFTGKWKSQGHGLFKSLVVQKTT